MLSRRLLAASVVLAVAPAVFAQAPHLSPPAFLPGDQVSSPAFGIQQKPDLVRGGNAFLAVWEDTRASLTGNLLPTQGGTDIFAARVDASGQLLDASPLILTQEGAEQTRPRAAWNGSEWLVVWISQVPSQFFWVPEIQAARVSAQGDLLDAIPLSLHNYGNSSSPDEILGVAADASGNWTVLWKEFSNNWSIQGKRISPQGVILDANAKTVATPASQPYSGDLAFAADEYLLVWNHWSSSGNDQIFGVRVSPSLTALDAVPRLLGSHVDYDVHPRVATDGLDFFVVWERYNTCCVGGGGKVYGTRVDHAGNATTPAGIAISGNAGDTIGRDPDVAWDGIHWFVTWSDGRGALGANDLFAARVSSTGVVVDAGGFPVDPVGSSQGESAVAGSPGGGAVVVWKDDRAGGVFPGDVFAAALAFDGTPGVSGTISVGAPTQIGPRVAATGSGYAVVFESAVSGGSRIVVQRMTLDGAVLDAEPIEVAPRSPDIHRPAIAWNGAEFLVVWANDQDGQVYGRRMDAGGTLLDAAPFAVMSGFTPAVAGLGGDFLVVAIHDPVNPEFQFPFGARVRGSDGAVLDVPAFTIGNSFALLPEVTAFAGQWLVTWKRNPTHDNSRGSIQAAFVSASGVPQAEFTVADDAIRFEEQPDVAASATEALFVWQDDRVANADRNVYARRMLPDGTLLDGQGFAITTAAGDQYDPAVAWNGLEFVSVFHDQRDNTFFMDERTDLFASRIDAGGVVLDPGGIAVGNSLLPEAQPDVAGAGGQTVLAGAFFRDDPGFRSYRVALRIHNGPWLDRGNGVGGLSGVPILSASGPLTGDTPFALHLTGGRPHAAAPLVVGFSELGVPFAGGTMVPFPDFLFFGFTTDGSGSLTLGATWPAGAPGVSIWFQHWLLDPTGPRGLTASNGLRGTSP